jgi:hypothetical protein
MLACRYRALPFAAYNLPQAAPHLTSEEDSYGNQEGNQKEIEQQFKKRKFPLPNFPWLQFEKRTLSLSHFARQQCEEEHAVIVIKEIHLEEILIPPQVLALCRQECRERNARHEKRQAEVRPQR